MPQGLLKQEERRDGLRSLAIALATLLAARSYGFGNQEECPEGLEADVSNPHQIKLLVRVRVCVW